MRSREVAVAVLLAMLCVAGAVGCRLRAGRLKSEASWQLARAKAAAAEYAATFEGAHVQRQLALFEERRLTLERAHLWQRGQYVLVLLAVTSTFAAFGFRLLSRLEAAEELPTST